MFVRFKFIDKIDNVQAFGKVNSDGSLDMPHDKVYDLTHLAIAVIKKIKGKAYECEVVWFIILIEILLCAVAYLMIL